MATTNHQRRPTAPGPLKAATLALAASSALLLLAPHRRPPSAPWEESATGPGSRSLISLSSLADPRSEAPRPPAQADPYLPRVHVYVKTSGKAKYLARSARIAAAYGRDADALTYLFDTDNVEEVDEFGRANPWLTVRHVNGTDGQGGYHSERGMTPREIHAAEARAYKAQRIKTRAVFLDFFGEGGGAEKYEWVCYMDDDMLVNVANLKADLADLAPTCLPDCLVTDEKGHSGIRYTQGGWCMNADLAERTARLLGSKTDEELRWTSTDDVSFNEAVMQKGLGVKPTDSRLWWSEYAWRRRDGKRIATKKLHGGTFEGVRREVLPSLAVYHTRFPDQP